MVRATLNAARFRIIVGEEEVKGAYHVTCIRAAGDVFSYSFAFRSLKEKLLDFMHATLQNTQLDKLPALLQQGAMVHAPLSSQAL